MRQAGRRCVGSRLSRSLLAALIVLLTVAGAVRAQTDERPRPTPEEATTELVELTTQLTPFTMTYDRRSKILAYSEVVESADKTVSDRVGRLEVRLDRVDPKRINYQPDKSAGPILIKGRPIAGQIHFFCRPDQRCIRRGFADANGHLNSGESTETEFTIDVSQGSVLNDLRLYAGLVQVLIAAADTD